MRTSTGYNRVEVLNRSEGQAVSVAEHEKSHLGRDLTLSAVCRDYYWSSMRADVTEAVTTCQRCCQFGNSLQKLLLQPIIRYAPFDLIMIDWLFMPDGTGNKHLILTIVDCFTRYIVAVAVKGPPTAAKSIKILVDYCDRLRTPGSILADNQFNTVEIREWCDEQRISIEFCAPYAHVGLAESANHLILERLRRICNLDIGHVPSIGRPPCPKNWVEQLQKSVSILNDRKLAYLNNYSPRELLFGAIPSSIKQPERIDPQLRLLLMDNARWDAASSFEREQRRRVASSEE